MTSQTQQLRRLYLICYTIGGIFTCMTVALLLWVALCIALEMEPLASLSFLPPMPTFVVFILLFAILAIAIAAWQYGASYHQRYEELLKKEPSRKART